MPFSVTAIGKTGLVAFSRTTAFDALEKAAELEREEMSCVYVNDLDDGE